MNRPFTGRHMLVLMFAFFGTIIAVNLVMATLAVRTFGGTVVDNSYVASQRFNGWLEEARAQAALGWQATFMLDTDRRIVAAVADRSGPVEGATVSASAAHPVGRAPDLSLDFVALGDGRYRSASRLPEGRWNLRVSIARGEQQVRLVEAMQ